MKNYFNKLVIFGFALIMTSCLVDDETRSDLNDQGPLLAGFTSTSQTISGISNGDTYPNEIKMEVKGPAIEEFQGDVAVTVAVNTALSTAIEGTHFSFPSKTITLSRSSNYTGKLPVTLLTEGIVAPLDVSPVLYLDVVSADGSNVVNNGKQIKITFNYLCFSNLAGTYDVEMHYINTGAGIDRFIYGEDEIVETAPGEYRAQRVAYWELEGGPGAIGGTNGYTFYDVCNAITIPAQNLVELYSNIVEGVIGNSFVNPETGVIYFEYTVCFGGACREFFVFYTPK